MKKIYLIAAMAAATMAASAQQALTVSTYAGTNLEKYDGQECRVTVNRYVFSGWNTIALPIALSEAELNDIFGSDCRLERLVAAEDEGSAVRLDFVDCKAEGMVPGTPYILHYTGETGTKRISKTAVVSDAEAAVSVVAKGSGEIITMACAQQQTSSEGLYGVLAVANEDATFVRMADGKKIFYATRCYIERQNDTELKTNHIKEFTTGIEGVCAETDLVDVYTLSGVRVASGIRASEVGQLPADIYVVGGQKVLVK